MTLARIVSGGQTGVDRGALDAALSAGIACGGWCPAGRMAEDGVIPDRYPLSETAECETAVRTRRNVRDSDATLILAPGTLSGGTLFTRRMCDRTGKPCLVIDADLHGPDDAAELAAGFVKSHEVRTLNVAGPRASGWDGASDYARAAIAALLGRCYPASERSAEDSSDRVFSGGEQDVPRQR